MLPRSKRGRRQSGGRIEVGDDRNLPVLIGSAVFWKTKKLYTPAVSKRPSVYGSSPIMTVTASASQLSFKLGWFIAYSCQRQ
jgi:hypothetical protein